MSHIIFQQKLEMSYKMSRDQLVKIVSTCQERSYAEEIELLQAKGNNVSWILEALASNEKDGISNDEASILQRKNVFGTNEKEVIEPPGIIQLFCQALEDFTLRILIAAACFSIALETGTAKPEDRSHAWIEGAAVLFAVIVCAGVTAINDYQKERQFLKLNSVADQKKKMTVRRDRILMQIHQDFVLVGDIVNINEGMQIPADGILIDSNEITTDESAMTGEIDPIKKNTLQFCVKKKLHLEQTGQKNIANRHQIPSPIIMSGTKVLSGEGKMVVLVVGNQSCIGKIRALLQKEESTPTPLQQKLEVLAEDIGKFGLYSAIVIIIILLIRFAIEKGISREWDTGTDLLKILNFFILGIIVVVVAIPEGLPLAVTLSLAFSVKKMIMDQNLVRKMEACETMGGANNICSDKTGTLTMNKMTLAQIWNVQNIAVDTYKETLNSSDLSSNNQFVELFKISSLVNSTALIDPEEKGSSTEIALLRYCKKMGADCEEYRNKFPTHLRIPFNSSRKRMSVIIDYKDDKHLFIKGASQIILSCSNKWFNSKTGQIEDITPQMINGLNDVIVKMAENSLRTLCLGYRKLSARDEFEKKDEKGVYDCQRQNIVLIAVIGVRDIPRKEVPEAIRKCHRAGITVRMVTGDNIITAKAIAKQIGIIEEGKQFLAMEGPDFHKLVGGVVCTKCRTAICDCPTDSRKAEEGTEVRIDTIANAEEFDKIQDKLLVLARSRPEDKYALVTGLKERGNVVAVTGDGTNDAPALKKADVGFAMGQSGTEVAREAAAIILIDDNFNSIVKAVLWGRNIYDSIRKFVQFQLTVNVVAVLITFIGACLLQKQILKPIQMLWINLIMDTLASLALATQDPDEQLLERAPHSRNEYIISKTMLKHIIGQAIFQIIVLVILVFWGERFIPQYADSYDTGVFASHPEYKWQNGVVGGAMRSGRFYYVSGSKDYETVFEATKVYSRHYTFIFNVFVMMQVFNFLNARKLHEEFNIFAGITKNIVFIFVVIGIFALQILLIAFTGSAFGVYGNYGLTAEQWMISIAIGSIAMIVNVILKLLPIAKPDHPQVETARAESESHSVQPSKLKTKSVLNLKRIEERVERDLAKNRPLD